VFRIEVVVFLDPFAKLFLIGDGETEEKLQEALQGNIALRLFHGKAQELIQEMSFLIRPDLPDKVRRKVCREIGKVDH
jgi:hypothetical protein